MDRVARRIELHDQAIRDATAAMPPPHWSPWYAASAIAFGVALVCSTFGAIFGLSLSSPKFGQAQLITSLLAGAITFYPLWRQQKKHEAAISARYKELLGEVGDDGAPILRN